MLMEDVLCVITLLKTIIRQWKYQYVVYNASKNIQSFNKKLKIDKHSVWLIGWLNNL
jgi:hypothetical protein